MSFTLPHKVPSTYPAICVKLKKSHYVFHDVTQRRALPRWQRQRTENITYIFLSVGIEPTTCYVYCRTLVSLHRDWPQKR